MTNRQIKQAVAAIIALRASEGLRTIITSSRYKRDWFDTAETSIRNLNRKPFSRMGRPKLTAASTAYILAYMEPRV